MTLGSRILDQRSDWWPSYTSQSLIVAICLFTQPCDALSSITLPTLPASLVRLSCLLYRVKARLCLVKQHSLSLSLRGVIALPQKAPFATDSPAIYCRRATFKILLGFYPFARTLRTELSRFFNNTPTHTRLLCLTSTMTTDHKGKQPERLPEDNNGEDNSGGKCSAKYFLIISCRVPLTTTPFWC